MSFRTERLAHAWPAPQADQSRTHGDEGVSKRSEESLSPLQAIGGWPVKESYQGFLTALTSFVATLSHIVALARDQTAKQRRSVRNDM